MRSADGQPVFVYGGKHVWKMAGQKVASVSSLVVNLNFSDSVTQYIYMQKKSDGAFTCTVTLLL